mgnify:CR=1 FL=1
MLQYYQVIYMNYNTVGRIRRVSNAGVGLIPCFLKRAMVFFSFTSFRIKTERMIFTRKHAKALVQKTFVRLSENCKQRRSGVFLIFN